MIQLDQKYDREQLLGFLKEAFLKDFAKDVRPVGIDNFKAIKKAYTLGSSSDLDLQVFEFEYSGSFNKRIALAKEAFQVMKQSATFQALAIFYSSENDDWRFSLMTANPQRTEKGNITVAYSNPRRYSFFLGPNAKTNTPTKFLIKKGMVIDFEDLKSRFSLEVVNKEFYKEIAECYTKLVGGTRGEGRNKKTYNSMLKLPAVNDHSQTSIEFAVRLIGRIIFCWFLREKINESGSSLMPKELLSLHAVSENTDYYHKILEPIFFEILNKNVKSRKPTYDDVYFSKIPYLNGGLFSPHDDYFSYNEGKQSQNHNTVLVPDSWLEELFQILETYNFTIDENTSIDEELSIDPEMLGRIFENLLAEINPETGESARKSTGSYYTPRVIVDYMVDESLLLYLKQKTSIDEDKLRAIISYDLSDDALYPLNETEKKSVVDAIEKVKILDPACGSGAFPIGALQKIVFILQQIDPDGKVWFQKQIQNTSPEIRRVIEREFSHENFDYIRKLGIIRENIYGIDIQPIATEIARLRCFLTLVVDERVDDTQENRGIEPLPNLDFKFVTANSLIGLPTSNKANQIGLFEDTEGIAELREIRDMFFTASGTEREQLKLQFVQIQNKMFQRLISENRRGHAELTTLLTTWDPFSHKISSWFDPEWMFGIKIGFDIVIANPPYVRADDSNFKDQREQIKASKQYYTLYEKWDLFIPFIEKGLALLNSEGILSYITSNSLLTSKFAFKLLEFVQQNYFTQFIDYFSDNTKVFDAGVVPVVFGLSSRPILEVVRKTAHENKFNNIVNQENIPSRIFKAGGKDMFKPSSMNFNIEIDSILLGDICYMSKGMVLNSDENSNKGAFSKDDLISLVRTEKNSKPYVEGKYIKRYFVEKVLFLEWNTERVPSMLSRATFPELYEIPKIMRGRVTEGIYDETGLVCNDSIVLFDRFCDLKGVSNASISTSIKKFNKKNRENLENISTRFDLKFILGILNSKFANSFLNSIRRHRLKNYFYPDDFRKLPIPNIPFSEQKKIIELVNKLISLKSSASGVDKEQVDFYENEIEQEVYKMYGLKKEEINFVEGKNKNDTK